MIRVLALAALSLDPWAGERLEAQSCSWGVVGGPVGGARRPVSPGGHGPTASPPSPPHLSAASIQLQPSKLCLL